MITICKDWYAWINRQPVGPPRFHLEGGVEVGNPGVELLLTKRIPQGINPSILLLDLSLSQKPGMWPQVITCATARYDEVLVPGSPGYTAVEIFENGVSVSKVDKVDTVT